MFNASQLAYLRALAKQSAGNAQVSFNHTRLLVKIGPTNEDRAALLLLLFLAGILLFLFLGFSLFTKEWVMAGILAPLLAGLIWGARRVLANQAQALQQPPNLVFDSTLLCFYVLTTGSADAPASYERYPSQSLVASRVRILSSNAYFDDTVIELNFGNNHWVKVLELNNSPFAYELERAIKYCQELSSKQTKSPVSAS